MNQQEEALQNLNIMNAAFDRTGLSFKKLGHYLLFAGLFFMVMDITIILYILLTTSTRSPALASIFCVRYTAPVLLTAQVVLMCLYRFHFIKSYEVFSRQLINVWAAGLVFIFAGRVIIGLLQNQTTQIRNGDQVFDIIGNMNALLICSILCLLLYFTSNLTKRKSLYICMLIPIANLVLNLLNFHVGISYSQIDGIIPPISFYLSIFCDPLFTTLILTGVLLSITNKKAGIGTNGNY